MGNNAVEEFHRQRKRDSLNDSIFDTDFVIDEDGGKRSTFKKILQNMFSTGKISDLFLLSYDKNANNENKNEIPTIDNSQISITSTTQKPVQNLQYQNVNPMKSNSQAALLSKFGYLVSGQDLMKINNAAEKINDNNNKFSPSPQIHHQSPLLPTIRPSENSFQPSFEGPIIVHDLHDELELPDPEDNVISPSHYQPLQNIHPQMATGLSASPTSISADNEKQINVQIMNDKREKVNENHQLFIPSSELDNFQEIMEKHLNIHNNDITLASTTPAPSRLFLNEIKESKPKGNYELFVKLTTSPPPLKLKDNTIVEVQKSINLRNKLITEHNGELLEEHEEINTRHQQQPIFFYPKATIKQQPTTKLVMLHQPLPLHKNDFYSNKAPISLPVIKQEPLTKLDLPMSKYEEYAFEHPSTASVDTASSTETSLDEGKSKTPIQVTRFVTKPLSSIMNIIQQDDSSNSNINNNNNKLQPASYMISVNGNLVPVQLHSIPFTTGLSTGMETVVEKIIKRPIQEEKIIERPYPVHIPFAVHVPYPVPMPLAYHPMGTSSTPISNISTNIWPQQNLYHHNHHQLQQQQQQRNIQPTFELSPPPEPPLGPIMSVNSFDYKTLPGDTDEILQQQHHQVLQHPKQTLMQPFIYNEIPVDGASTSFDINASSGGNNIELPANYIIDNRPQTGKMKNIWSGNHVYHLNRTPNKQQSNVIRNVQPLSSQRFQKQTQTMFPYQIESMQNMKPPANTQKNIYFKNNSKNKNNNDQTILYKDISFPSPSKNSDSLEAGKPPPFLPQQSLQTPGLLPPPKYNLNVHSPQGLFTLLPKSNINQNLNLYSRDYPLNHHKKRSPDFGRTLRVEYGFKPPLIPSLEIDDKGLPLPPKKSDSGA